jgi:hypothetical protein
MCVCVWFLCVSVSACMCGHMHACESVCLCLCMGVCVCLYLCVCVCLCMHVYASLWACMCMCVYVCVCACVQMQRSEVRGQPRESGFLFHLVGHLDRSQVFSLAPNYLTCSYSTALHHSVCFHQAFCYSILNTALTETPMEVHRTQNGCISMFLPLRSWKNGDLTKGSRSLGKHPISNKQCSRVAQGLVQERGWEVVSCG